MQNGKVKILKAPERDSSLENRPSVFLAGSIEMGEAEDWQVEVTKKLDGTGVVIFNPRRDDWDSSWVQDISNDNFNEQVNWELDHLSAADQIILYFHPDTKAPISLLELGLHAPEGKMVVCCPPGYWRRGNVQIVCDRFNIPLYDRLDDVIEEVKKRI
jgi:hypothetical protein